jgi:hypothetical protein
MPKGIGYSIAVAFIIAIMFGISSKNGWLSYTWFSAIQTFIFIDFEGQQIRNLEVGMEMKSSEL